MNPFDATASFLKTERFHQKAHDASLVMNESRSETRKQGDENAAFILRLKTVHANSDNAASDFARKVKDVWRA